MVVNRPVHGSCFKPAASHTKAAGETVALLEIKINLERTAEALERIAGSLERLAGFVVPAPPEPREKAKPRNAVRVASTEAIWLIQQARKQLRNQGLSPKQVDERMEELRLEEMEELSARPFEGPSKEPSEH